MIHELKEGDIISNARIVTWSPRTWVSGMIRLFTKSYYSHSALIVMFNGIPFVAEADIGGGKAVPWSNWVIGKKGHVYRPKNPIKTETIIRDIGRIKYDYFNTLVQQPIHILFGKWIGRKGMDDKFQCAEYIDTLYNMSDNPYNSTPSWVYRHLHFIEGEEVGTFMVKKAPVLTGDAADAAAHLSVDDGKPNFDK